MAGPAGMRRGLSGGSNRSQGQQQGMNQGQNMQSGQQQQSGWDMGKFSPGVGKMEGWE